MRGTPGAVHGTEGVPGLPTARCDDEDPDRSGQAIAATAGRDGCQKSRSGWRRIVLQLCGSTSFQIEKPQSVA